MTVVTVAVGIVVFLLALAFIPVLSLLCGERLCRDNPMLIAVPIQVLAGFLLGLAMVLLLAVP